MTSTAVAMVTPASARTVPVIAKPTISFKPLHPTFGAEGSGVDWSNVTQETVDEIKAGLAKYGVLVFRKTGLDDERHVTMSHLFGDLDDIKPFVAGLGQVNRLSSDYLFDVSNVNPDGTVTQPDSMRALLLRCNLHFHADSAFNPRRAGISLLLAHHLPPPDTGGDTEFADTRAAYADLPAETKAKIADYVVMNSQLQCRRGANPGNPRLGGPEFEPMNHRFGKHKLAQLHEASGRMNLYIAAHAHHIEGMPVDDGKAILDEMLAFASQEQYRTLIKWDDPGDLVIWDNTCVLHRAVPGTFEGKYKRDLRRTTVHDMSSQAWGLNEAFSNMNKVKSALSTGSGKITGVFNSRRVVGNKDGNDLQRLSNAAEAERQASMTGRQESSLNRIHIVIHGASAFFTFLAICLTGAVAAFQAKWVKVSGGTGFVLFLLLLTLTLSCTLLVIPIAYDRWDKARRPAQFLAQPRSSLILNIFGGFLMICVAIITSAAGFGGYCKNLGGYSSASSSSKDSSSSGSSNTRRADTTSGDSSTDGGSSSDGSSSSGGDTTTSKDMSGYESGYAGWCRTRQASAVFAWLSFFCWLSLAVLAGLAFRKERQLARRREPAFTPPEEEEVYGVGPGDDIFADKHEAPGREDPTPRPVRQDYSRLQNADSAMARPSVDAYGAFDGDMPGSDGREQPSRTMQMAYSDPYAQIRQSVLNDSTYGPPSPSYNQAATAPRYGQPPNYGGY